MLLQKSRGRAEASGVLLCLLMLLQTELLRDITLCSALQLSYWGHLSGIVCLWPLLPEQVTLHAGSQWTLKGGVLASIPLGGWLKPQRSQDLSKFTGILPQACWVASKLVLVAAGPNGGISLLVHLRQNSQPYGLCAGKARTGTTALFHPLATSPFQSMESAAFLSQKLL